MCFFLLVNAFKVAACIFTALSLVFWTLQEKLCMVLVHEQVGDGIFALTVITESQKEEEWSQIEKLYHPDLRHYQYLIIIISLFKTFFNMSSCYYKSLLYL